MQTGRSAAHQRNVVFVFVVALSNGITGLAVRSAHESFGSPGQETGPADSQPEEQISSVWRIYKKVLSSAFTRISSTEISWVVLENLHFGFSKLEGGRLQITVEHFFFFRIKTFFWIRHHASHIVLVVLFKSCLHLLGLKPLENEPIHWPVLGNHPLNICWFD